MSCSQRFNAFHLEVSIQIDRIKFILEKSDLDEDPIHFAISLLKDMESLIDSQDCRDDSDSLNLPSVA